MKRITTLLSICFIALATVSYAQSQQIQLLNESFNGVSWDFDLNTSDSPGSDIGGNTWVVNSLYVGGGVPNYPATTNQSSTTAGSISGAPTSAYLHIHDSLELDNSGIGNCNYKPSSISDRFVAMKNPQCTAGYDSVKFVFFNYAGNAADAYGEVYYQRNGGAWTKCGKNKYNSVSGKWEYETISDPAFIGAGTIRFGFRWVNGGAANATATSWGIDDVQMIGYINPNAQGAVNSWVDNVFGVAPDTVCRTYSFNFQWHLTDTLCDGIYTVELSDAVGNFSNPTNVGGVYVFFPNLGGTGFSINLPGNIPLGNGYRIRLKRFSPTPSIIGTVSEPFVIKDCENEIWGPAPGSILMVDKAKTLNPKDTICVNSIISFQFWSTGLYEFNSYVGELSDVNGSFADPDKIKVLQDKPEDARHDPVDNPLVAGSMGGKIPDVEPGCNYYIRVRSTSPVASIMRIYGPFCIRRCDIEAETTSLSFCITDSTGACADLPFNVHVSDDGDPDPDNSVTYFPDNHFLLELLYTTPPPIAFTRAAIGEFGGDVNAIDDSVMTICIPALKDMPIPPGSYLARIVATHSSRPDASDNLGALFSLTIGVNYYEGEDAVITRLLDANAGYPLQDTFCVDSDGPSGPILGEPCWVLAYPHDPISSTWEWESNIGLGGNTDPGQPFYPVLGWNNPYQTSGFGFTLYGQKGFTGYFKIRENNNGCLSNWSPDHLIYFDGPPDATISGPSPFCEGDTGHYSTPYEQNNPYYEWTLSVTDTNRAVFIKKGNNEVDVYFKQSGTYNLCVTALNKCGTSNNCKTIVIKKYPTANAAPDTTICEGQSVTLTTNLETQSITYEWYLGTSEAGTQVGTTQNVVVAPLEDATYFVKVTRGGACSKTDTVHVDVNHTEILPELLDSVCLENKILLDAGPYEGLHPRYQWSTGDTTQTIEADTGTFTCNVYVDGNVCPKELSFRVDSMLCRPKIEFPNIFTPNGDGTNDMYKAITIGKYDTFAFKIYNRWGIKVYETDQQYFQWDGNNMNSNQACPDGTYYWEADYSYKGEAGNEHGFVTLMRQ